MGVHLWAFVGIAALVIVAPGPDTVLVTKNALIHGRRAALGTSLGVNTGLLIWTVAAALGLAAVVRESAVAFTVLKLVGAVYLVWLGLQALRAARRHAVSEPLHATRQSPRVGALLGFRQLLLLRVAPNDAADEPRRRRGLNDRQRTQFRAVMGGEFACERQRSLALRRAVVPHTDLGDRAGLVCIPQRCDGDGA